MTNTMTYAQALTFAIENITNKEVTDRLTTLKAQVEKRATSERKPTKRQVENTGLKADILAMFEYNDTYRSGEIANLMGMSVQRASALLNQMVKDDFLKKVIDKKITYFTITSDKETIETAVEGE